MFVNDGIESKSTPPAGAKILHTNTGIAALMKYGIDWSPIHQY